MKTVFVAAAGLAVAQASMKSLTSNIRSYTKSNANVTGRAFTGDAETAFAPINGYGCWCYLDDTWRDANQVLINRPAILAHGQVVDTIDESCRELINAYKCVEMDAEANGITDCDAQAVAYVPFNFDPLGDLTTDCRANNVEECAQNACIVEGAFILRYAEDVAAVGGIVANTAGYTADHQHTSQGGTFDPEVNCPGIPNPVGSDKECCGMFSMLSRKPFRLYSGFTTRKCCANEVINEELNQCCTDALDVESVVDINDVC